MNWKTLNQACPRATIEYLRSEDIITNDSKTMVCTLNDVDDSTYFFKTDNEESFCIGSEEVLKMPEYFDALGIIIEAVPFDIRVTRKWAAEYYINWSYMGYLMDRDQVATFPTRRESLEAGIVKAFEIREEQLKQKSQP